MFRQSFSRIRVPVYRRNARNMAGHGHAAPPPSGGLDGLVRKYLPEDHHVSMGILAFYASLYILSGFIFGGKKKTVAAAPVTIAAVAPSSSDSMPSVDSPAFATWISTPGNLEKHLTS